MRRLLALMWIGAGLLPAAQAQMVEGPAADLASVHGSTAPIVLMAVSNKAFGVGEKLTFVIKYEFIHAGFATMEVSDGPPVDGYPATLQIHSRAESKGVVDAFFKVRDFNASIVDHASLSSLNFHQNLKEGHYSVIRNTAIDYRNRRYKFHRIRKGSVTERSGAINQPVFDILSAFFYARTLPLELGGKYEITVFSDEDIYQLVVRVHKKLQKVNVAAGKFECLRLEPVVLGDGIFKAKEGKMQLWLTNDERKMPVLLRSKVFIGSFDAELVSFEPK